MKPSTIHDIKQELIQLPATRLTEICLRLAKFKKENKELLSYLLFESFDGEGYIRSVKQEMDELFTEVHKSNLYLAKKVLRKILRIANKHIRYIGSRQAEVELLLHFCSSLKQSGIAIAKSQVLLNIYNNQIKKIRNTVETLHEDLQYDYLREINKL
jgi:hypothetical protein